ncbi:MAG: FAD-binding protein, partial [Alphaproteobacteria bacterium]|nr:FAD-binding protein [Alphaproteobacteria bacterium]
MRNVPIRTISPATPDAVVHAVAEAGAKGRHIEVIGGGTKRAIGVLGAADLVVSTAGLNRVIDYAPDELVLTAQPGVRIADLETLVAG